MLELILNDGDMDRVKDKGQIMSQMDYLERVVPGQTPAVDNFTMQDPPRFLKTHLAYKYMRRVVEEDKVKVILLLRNPRDTLVSFYHFYRMGKVFGNFPGSFDDFMELVKAKNVGFGDIFEWYSGWWKCSGLDHVLVLRYEDLTKDPLSSATKLCTFLGKQLPEDQLKKIIDEASFEKMDKNPITNVESLPFFNESISKFYRKGKVGDWMNHFTEEHLQFVDDKCKECFDSIGLSFDYESPGFQ